MSLDLNFPTMINYFAAGTNDIPKCEGARDNEFLVTHPMIDQRCLTSAISRRSALTAGPYSFLRSPQCARGSLGIRRRYLDLLMSLLLGPKPSLWITHKENGP
jgi:hypothetical protein